MRYYNKTKGPLSATLTNGDSCFFPPKQWTELAEEFDGSEAIAKLISKGFIVRALEVSEVELPQVKVPEPEVKTELEDKKIKSKKG